MPDTDRKKAAKSMLEKVVTENNLGKLECFYYAYHERSLWWDVLHFLSALDGIGGGDTPNNIWFYVGLTDSHMVMQRFNHQEEPVKEPLFGEFSKIKYKGQLNMHPGIKFYLKVSGKKFALHVPDTIDNWDNCEEDFKQFTSLIDQKIRLKK